MTLDTRQGTQVACTGLGGTNPPPPTHTKDRLQDPVHSNLVTAGKPGARQTMLHPQRAGGTVVRELALNRTPCFQFSPVAMGGPGWDSSLLI